MKLLLTIILSIQYLYAEDLQQAYQWMQEVDPAGNDGLGLSFTQSLSASGLQINIGTWIHRSCSPDELT